ncbi:hypothetical protein AXX17_AT2G09020 [Arabidopsis thaliana]|uniref:Uncharacterized protein n=1 Tax=Arabidopsis thaliana TaxID=3702 RepID=A0A178VT08_ARATH|nr:hypothetical protein AXX17_AT2G09020 [Arabidopsis thaliana]
MIFRASLSIVCGLDFIPSPSLLGSIPLSIMAAAHQKSVVPILQTNKRSLLNNSISIISGIW